jgi:pimeloyl-ACP methyl ester carboxylesterase
MRRLQIRDVRLNCRVVEADCPAVPALFLHGLNANMAFWHPRLLTHLRQDRRLILQDLRGHGYSEMPPSGYTPANLADDAAAILDACMADRAEIVAHSFGSNIALQLLRRHPDRVRSVTLLDARTRLLQPRLRLGDWCLFERWRRNFEAAGIRIDPDWEFDHTLSLKFPAEGLAEACRNLGADGFFVPRLGARAMDKYRKLITGTRAHEEFLDLTGLTVEGLRAIRTPTLLVYGSQSPFLPTRDGLLREIPGCRCEMLEGGGHNFPFMMPDRTAQAIRAFWAAMPPAGCLAAAGEGEAHE